MANAGNKNVKFVFSNSTDESLKITLANVRLSTYNVAIIFPSIYRESEKFLHALVTKRKKNDFDAVETGVRYRLYSGSINKHRYVSRFVKRFRIKYISLFATITIPLLF